jgi:signal transduction histidine kinase
MTALSKFLESFQPLLLPNARESQNPPILKLCRVYCLLAIGAALLISVCFYVNSWLWEEIASMQMELFRKGFTGSIFLNRFNFLLNWFGLLMLIGAIIYGFKIARQAGADAINNAQLVHETKQRTMEIAALYDTLQHVAEKHELRALLQTILEKAKTLLAAAGCAIFLYDKEHDDFQIAVEVGVGMPIGTHIPRNEGLGGIVADTLQPIIINDYPNWDNRSKALRKLPISAAVCVPMIRGGELIGVLGVHEVGGTDRKFTEADARLLSLFADNAAGAVHNARLLDALQNSEERFRIAAQCASDMVYDWDLPLDHVDYFGALFERSRAANTKLARSRAEYWDMIHPDDRGRIEKALRDHFETGQPFSEEYRIDEGSGSYINVADRATAIRNQKGVPLRLIGAVSDITERKQAEQMKSDFVSFVSHQLRTPLSGIKWMLELAVDSLDSPEDLRSFIQDARTSTERLIGLVNDLLDISRLERGKLHLEFQNINLAELTKDVADEITPLTMEKEQALSIDAASDLPQVSGDMQMLRQAVLNLISNAVKYTPPGGKIHIEIGHAGDRVLWSIKDTGIGIPKADIGKLFEKFYRAGNAVAVETEGTGLGLYLVRLIIERLGGKVWCESAEGAGSRFQFTLPIAV